MGNCGFERDDGAIFHRGGDPPAEGGLVFDGFYGFSHDHTAANGPAVVVAFVQFCKNDVQIFYGFAKALSGSNFFGHDWMNSLRDGRVAVQDCPVADEIALNAYVLLH